MMSNPGPINATKTIVFAGGGTGGHLYPALAVMERIAESRAPARFVYLCSDRPIDRKILGDAAVDFRAIPARPFGLHPARLFRFLFSWPAACHAADRALRELASPNREIGVVVAMGGFVAAPAARAATRRGLPLVLINLDAIPGKANRWIARHARLTLAAAGAEPLPGARAIRPIVRKSALAAMDPAACRTMLGLDASAPTLFVTGGSQGAGSINDLLRLLVSRHRGMFSGWQVFHQAGPDDESAVQEAYDRAGVPARVVAFCREMGSAWGAADMAISRCGAGAVAEVWANAVPAVFLPYPYHRDQHQRHNAQPIVSCGGGFVCDDLASAERTAAGALPVIEGLLATPERLPAMRAAIRSLGPADGADLAAAAILGML